MFCTSKERETCDVEKRTCTGCYYNKNGDYMNEEEIIAPAYKAEDGRIFISRHSHAEIVQMFADMMDKEAHKNSEQGFITSHDRFVDRKEALEIAKKNNKNLKKICQSDELYSEDLFLKEERLQEEIIKLYNKLQQEKEKNKKLEEEHLTSIQVKCIQDEAYIKARADFERDYKESSQLYEKVIDMMAEEIVDFTGSCPADIFDKEWDEEEGNCEHCKNTDKECFIKYYFKKARGEEDVKDN